MKNKINTSTSIFLFSTVLLLSISVLAYFLKIKVYDIDDYGLEYCDVITQTILPIFYLYSALYLFLSSIVALLLSLLALYRKYFALLLLLLIYIIVIFPFVNVLDTGRPFPLKSVACVDISAIVVFLNVLLFWVSTFISILVLYAFFTAIRNKGGHINGR